MTDVDVPFLNATRTTDGAIDPTGFRFLRLYIRMNSGATNHTMYIDNTRFVS